MRCIALFAHFVISIAARMSNNMLGPWQLPSTSYDPGTIVVLKTNNEEFNHAWCQVEQSWVEDGTPWSEVRVVDQPRKVLKTRTENLTPAVAYVVALFMRLDVHGRGDAMARMVEQDPDMLRHHIQGHGYHAVPAGAAASSNAPPEAPTPSTPSFAARVKAEAAGSGPAAYDPGRNAGRTSGTPAEEVEGPDGFPATWDCEPIGLENVHEYMEINHPTKKGVYKIIVVCTLCPRKWRSRQGNGDGPFVPWLILVCQGGKRFFYVLFLSDKG